MGFHAHPTIGDGGCNHGILQHTHRHVALTNGGLAEGSIVGDGAERALGHGESQVILFLHPECGGGGAQLVGAHVDGHLHKGGVARVLEGCEQ